MLRFERFGRFTPESFIIPELATSKLTSFTANFHQGQYDRKPQLLAHTIADPSDFDQIVVLKASIDAIDPTQAIRITLSTTAPAT